MLVNGSSTDESLEPSSQNCCSSTIRESRKDLVNFRIFLPCFWAVFLSSTGHLYAPSNPHVANSPSIQKGYANSEKNPTILFHLFVSNYGMLNAMFAVFESAKTHKSLDLQVYGRRVTKYGRSKSVYSPFQSDEQFTDYSTPR